jgi:hypothetical protein
MRFICLRFVCLGIVAMVGLSFAGLLVRAANEPATQPAASVELPKPDADGFISLFNGKDLTGWEGLSGYWSVKDGAIDGSEMKENSKQTFLVLSASKADPARFANFELHVTYRFVGNTGNSGIQFRSRMMIPETYRVGGYQVDSDATRPYDGNLYDEGGQAGGRNIMASRGFKTTWDANNVRKNEPLAENPQMLTGFIKPPGEWNALILVANGHHMTTNLNGHLMADVYDDSPKALKDGLIAIQLHMGYTMSIQAKDIKIKFLTEEPK